MYELSYLLLGAVLQRLADVVFRVVSIAGAQCMGDHLGNQESDMNWDRIEGNWKQLKGKMKEQWGDLTDDDLDVAAGKREQLVGRLQERYGIAKDKAEDQLDRWAASAEKNWLK